MSTCIFCQIAARHPAHAGLTVFENEYVFSQISLRQKCCNHGHVLVIPKRHIENIYELPPEIDAPLMSALRLMAGAVKEAFRADGVNVRQNNDSAAGQDVFHLHFHVIPRFRQDGFEENRYEELDFGRRKDQAEKLNVVIGRILRL